MKGIVPLFLGIFGTFAFSWAGLILIPNYQIGHLDPQVDEDGNDPYPAPKSGMADRGRRLYAANGCAYCHSQQVRGDYAAPDLERTRDLDPRQKWGERRSAPRDYLFERPVVLGKMRLGPDLSNIGKSAPVEGENASAPASPTPAGPASPATTPAPGASPSAPPAAAASATPATSPAAPAAPGVAPNAVATAPSTTGTTAPTNGAAPPYTAAWHHRHLYSPRSLVLDSNMPAYHFLYEKRRISGERAADALKFDERDKVPEGWEVVPTYDAKCLVAYLMSLDQSHPLKEVKASAAPPSSAPATSPAAAVSPAPAPPKEGK
jgi:cbb3-type cytochrome oxidase cytochrome c subunit